MKANRHASMRATVIDLVLVGSFSVVIYLLLNMLGIPKIVIAITVAVFGGLTARHPAIIRRWFKPLYR